MAKKKSTTTISYEEAMQRLKGESSGNNSSSGSTLGYADAMKKLYGEPTYNPDSYSARYAKLLAMNKLTDSTKEKEEKKESKNVFERVGSVFQGTGSRDTEGFTTEQSTRYNDLLSQLDDVEEAAGYVTTTDQADENETKRKAIIAALNQLDTEAGREAREYDEQSRAGDILAGWGRGTKAAYQRIGGMLNDLAVTADEDTLSVLDSGNAGWATDELTAANMAAAMKGKEGAGVVDETKARRDDLYSRANYNSTKSQELDAKTKYGTSAAGSFLIDAARTGLDMGTDAIVNGLTFGGAGLVNMGVRAFGQSAQQSAEAGDDLGTQVAKGLVSSAIEVFTEKLGGGFENIYGKSITDKLFSEASTPVIRAVADFMDIAGVKFVKETAEEGFEEWLSDALNMIADHALGWSEEGVSFIEDWNAEKEQRIYDTVLGAFMGAFGGSVNLATSQMTADTDIANEALSNAALMADSGDAYFDKIYNKYNTKAESGKSLTNADVEKLSTRTQQAATAYDSNQISTAVQERLTALGETADVEKVSNAITKQAMGEGLSSSESKLIADSKYGTRVSNELNTNKIATGETGAEWVRKIGTKATGGRYYGSELSKRQLKSDFKVSKNKKAQDSSGNDIEITGVASLGKDGMMLSTADGRTVKASDVSYATNADAYVYDAVSKMGLKNAENANEVLQIFKESDVDADVYARAALMAISYGKTGQHSSLMQSKDGLTGMLNQATREALYNIGVRINAEQKSSDQQKVNKNVRKAKVGNGKIHLDVKSDESGYTAKQKTGIRTAEFMSGMTNRDVHIFESYKGKDGLRYYKDSNGKETVAPNGFIDENGDIWLDLNSGNNGEGIILNTYAHELTHFIKMFAPEKFDTFAKVLFEEINKSNQSFNFGLELRRYMNEHKGLTADEAIEEMVADACDTMLQNGRAQSVFGELQTNKVLKETMGEGFWAEFKKHMRKLVDNLKATIDAYRGVGSETRMGKLVREMEGSYEMLQRLWTEALSEAADVARYTEKNTADNGSIKNSIRQSYEKDVDKWIKAGKPDKRILHIGTTSEPLQSVGVDDKNIFWDTTKINKIFKEHPEINEDVIKQVPNVLEYPILIMESKTQVNRVTMFGEVYGTNNVPVMVALELLPTNKKGFELDEIKVVSAYTKGGISGTQELINTSRILYVEPNKKRTESWLRSTQLQLPFHSNFGSIGKVTLIRRDVKGNYTFDSKTEDVADWKQQLNDLNLEYDEKTESANPTVVAHSERTWTESEYVQAREQAAEDLAKALDISTTKALAYIESVNSIAKAIAEDRNRLDFIASEGVSALVGNTEYGGSIDFSTICKKRRLLTGTFSAIQRALPNTALTAEEILQIRHMMDEKGYEVNCGLCYVEGSRAKMGEYAKDFLELFSKTDPEYLPNMAEINTPEGIEKIRIEHPEVYAAYEKYMNALAQRKPKLYQLATEYKGEILNKFKDNKAQVEKYNHNGGLRLQSFSDFEIIHLLDNMQVIMDMARVGLAGQAYTKVPEFAWAMGATGLKINLSLISKGVNANGRIILDEKEGMKRADAEALRNAFSDNVGTILVVFNDEQLKAAMADDFIDFIIPFHRSQWNKAQYKLMGLPEGAKDYTPWQNESYINPVFSKTGKKQRPSNYMPNNYWDFSKSGKENAEQYLLMCAMGNRTPKFSNLLVNNGDGSYSLQPDGSTDGYWKLLIDFKMYNNEGKGVPQKPVQPIFNEGSAEDPHSALGMLAAYEGGHQEFPVAQDIVDSFVDKYKSDHPGVKYSNRSYMEAVESNDMETAQQMVDEAAKAAGFTVKAFHGSPTKGITVFDRLKAGKNTEAYSDKAIWFSNDEELAESFSKTTRPSSRSSMIDEVIGDNGTVYGTFLKLGKTMDFRNLTEADRDLLFSMNTFYKDRAEFDANLDTLLQMGNHQIPKIFINYDTLIENGYNSVVARIYTNMNAEMGRQRTDRSNPSTETVEYGILDPGQIKSADPVTYDDNGNVIPLSERFSESKDIRYSERTDANNAAEHFGTTENYHEAGYILADGRMLDFSGRHWGSTNADGRRDVDHEDIWEVLQRSGDNRLYFINEGNIRFSPEAPGINLSAKREPTAEQYDRIREFLKQEGATSFYVDFEGRKADKLQYSGNVNADRVIADMKKYYRTGETSEQSVVSQFHFADDYYDPKVHYSQRVTNPDTLEFLNKQIKDGDYVVTYKSFLEIDGKLYPPMASMTKDENGKYKMANAMEYGKWEESIGNPKNIIIGENGKGYYNLKKDNGKTIRAAYNPYQHSSNLVLNDQFEEAYQRPNLVTVKCYIPKSELTSGYRAQYAKDAVGLHDWKAGTVASKLKNLKRQVYLSRWLMPVERVSDAKVAAMYKEYLAGENVSVPFNVVPPALLKELEKAGVPIDYEGSPIYRRTHEKTSETPMKFSERYDGFSNRELLAEALEDTALTATERNYIKEYQRMIGTVDVAEMQIEKINNDLQTETDPDRITFLKNELKVYADRIDRYDQKLFKLVSTVPMKSYLDRKVEQAIAKEHGNAVAAREKMQQRYRESRAALVSKMTQEKRQAVAEVRQTERQRADERVEKQRVKDMLSRQKADERREENAGRSKYKKQVQEKVQRLTDWLLKNSDKEHIPENLKAPLLEFITAIDFDSKTKLAGGEPTKADEKFAARLLRLEQMLRSQQEALDGDENATGFDTYIDLPTEAVDFLKEMSAKVTEALNNGEVYTVNAMTAEELKSLSNFLSAITTSIRQMNRLLANARYQSIQEAADQDIQEMEDLGRVRDSESRKKFFKWMNATPYFAMKRFGKGGASIFEAITKGWEKFAFNAKQIIDFANKTYTKKEVNEWKNDIRTVELEDGSEIRISIAQIMALKCLLKRDQAVQHMQAGGVRIGNIQTGKNTITDTTHYHFSLQDTAKLLTMLNERQAAVADRLQSYMAVQGSKWGNEVSMRRFGYEFYTEGETYFPIQTDANDRPMRDTDAQTNSMFRLLNLSSSKSLNPKATNALVVNDIFDVFADHMADQAKLNGLGLPILDAIKWFSYREKINGDDGTYTTRTLQGAMEQAYGTAAQKYFKTLMKDINGVKESGDRGTGWKGKLMSNYKIASVAANLRVAFLQPTSYIRASFKISPKYLAAAFAHKNGYEEAMKYSGTAVWKSLGYYDTDISRGLRQQIEHDDTLRDTVAEKSMVFAELGDKLTWGRLWVACKLQTKAKNSSLTGEALNQATADLFREVIYSSQVMDSTLTRSEIMRGSTLGTKMMTAFMAEPTLSYNILLDAYSSYDNDVRAYGKAEAWKRNSGGIGKAFAVYVSSAAFSAVVESLADAVRDDDDEDFLDKFLEALLGEKIIDGNLAQDLSIIGKIPVLKDLLSALQGYSGTDMTTASFTSIINAANIWIETIQLANGTLESATKTTYYGKMTPWGKIYKSLQALSQLTGYAVSNLCRDATAIWNTVMNGINRPDMKVRTYDDGSTEKWSTLKDIFPNKSEYDAYTEYISNIHSTDDKTKKEQVVEYINGLNITRAQKDRLYLLNYKESTIDEAPWH